MASGMADYQRVVRPKYGAGLFAAGTKEVEANKTTLLVNVEGKGMVYGGSVGIVNDATQRLSRVGLALQEGKGISITLYAMNLFGMIEARKLPLGLTKYDDTNFIYGVGVSYGLTFESYLSLYYVEEHGVTFDVSYMLAYALN